MCAPGGSDFVGPDEFETGAGDDGGVEVEDDEEVLEDDEDEEVVEEEDEEVVEHDDDDEVDDDVDVDTVHTGVEPPVGTVEPMSPQQMLENTTCASGWLARMTAGLPSALLHGPLLPLSSQFM